MEIETIKSNDGSNDLKIEFVLKGTNNSFVNAVRRSVNEIPVLAVDTVEISANDSALNDEILAHRIGLLPLKYDKTFTLPEECSCKGKGCAKCTATLTLKASGGAVKAGELKSKTVDVLYPEMPLTLLQKDQEIELMAEARLGRGINHSKFSPGLMWFREYPIIELPKNAEACKDCVKVCPKGVFSIDGKVAVKNLLNCDLCEACVDECRKLGKEEIVVKGSKEDFIISIESWGQLRPKEIFIEACEILDKNIKEFLKEASKIK